MDGVDSVLGWDTHYNTDVVLHEARICTIWRGPEARLAVVWRVC